jgi:hypothetical protein
LAIFWFGRTAGRLGQWCLDVSAPEQSRISSSPEASKTLDPGLTLEGHLKRLGVVKDDVGQQ